MITATSQEKWHKSVRLFREPVAPSLTPTALQWQPVESGLLAILAEVFGNQGEFLAASGTSDSKISYCRVTDVDRHLDLFIKIIPKCFASGLRRSGDISDYVHGRGLHTPACLPTFPKVAIDGRLIFAYRFIEGGYLKNSTDNLQKLGNALARLHTALLNFPDAKKIAGSQHAMRTKMRRKAKELIANPHWAANELAPARAHVQRWLEIDAMLNTTGNQVIHNDLHAGNILHDAQDNIWFLDFEEAIWSYLPPFFDIARIIERFILAHDDWNVQTKINASEQLLNAYQNGHYDRHEIEGSIPIALDWLLGFAWLRMENLLCDPKAIQHPEVRKFLHLADLQDKNKSWLAML